MKPPRARIHFEKTREAGDPFSFYQAFRGKTPSVLLESARRASATGRYSIVAKDPFLILRYQNGRALLEYPRTQKIERRSENPLRLMRELLDKYSVLPVLGSPPFAGGAVGYVGYECKGLIEPAAAQRPPKPHSLPDMYFLFFDACVVWDHRTQELFLNVLSCPGLKTTQLNDLRRDVRQASRRKKTGQKSRASGCGPMQLQSSFSEAQFRKAVRQAKKYIRQGEIFQANLSQRFSFLMKNRPERVYARLREINPSPFFGVLDAKDFQIISGSPERLLKLEGRRLQTRPIAGTRWRGKTDREDRRLSLELMLSEKERAEHLMLVDLERNDLGRVCEYGSVSVDEFMALEDYSHVKHIVSNVRGTLREGLTALDAFCAFFPGGTITGAPKIRCMQIIDELESVARGPYTGSMGYFSFTGNMDFNILIRSLVVRDSQATLHVGAGIVADSDPKREYHETLYKAEAVLSAVFGPKPVRSFFRRHGVSAGIS